MVVLEHLIGKKTKPIFHPDWFIIDNKLHGRILPAKLRN
jgi:hypothetical protein